MKYLSRTSPSKLRGTVLVRLDFNTVDEWRMRAALPTLNLLLRRAARIVILSHRGRPRKNEPRLSLRKDGVALSRMLRQKVNFIPHFRFEEIKRTLAVAPASSIFLLENLRFQKGERANSARFARKLAGLADYYVNDSFAVDHRADASLVAITRFLPAYVGLGLEQELNILSKVLRRPDKPLVLVIGGGKAEDKLGVVEYFRRRADVILIGGAAANTLLYIRGVNVGESLMDETTEDYGRYRRILKYPNLFLPLDWEEKKGRILDIGPRTRSIFSQKIKAARMIIWAGPMGYIENPRFAQGNLAIARAIIANQRAFSVTGGGETVMFLKKHGLDKKFSFISTGGGAMIDFLAGKKLPGIEALKRRRNNE